MAVGRVTKGRGVIVILGNRPCLGTLSEAGDRGAGFLPSQVSRAPSMLKAGIKAEYTVFIYCESCCPEKQDPHPGSS